VCGIAGIFGRADQASVQKMTDAMAHRGPDDRGIWSDPEVPAAIGHCRLSIIDLSPAGHQPMSYANGRLWITYNGEVYNFKELRAELEGHGYQFQSNSDTEAILAAYTHWGVKCLKRLRGMFAFAIWDKYERSLLLVRDRFGIKPLYYAQCGSKFIFASEIKAMLASGLISRQTDRQAIWDYLSHGSILQPRTILQDVKMLLPGHYLLIRDGRITEHKYWDIEEATRQQRRELANLSYQEATSELRRQFEEATRLHLIADVHVGAFLSGGIDSTAVVGLMSQLVSHPIKTFSIGFDREYKEMSELHWAKIAAQRHGSEHHEVVIDGQTVAHQFDSMISAIDQPSIDGANTYIVSQAASQEVTVALSGLGGDELLAGYPQFYRIPWAHKVAPRGWAWLRPLFDATERLLPELIREPMSHLVRPPLERYTILRPLISEADKWTVTRREWRELFQPEPILSFYKRMSLSDFDPVTGVSYAEINGYLRDTLLRDCDAMSMAYSLEVRPVLLDHHLAEFIFSLPDGYKIGQNQQKKIFVDACRDLLPNEIVNRSKMGFSFPLEKWLQTTLQEKTMDILQSDAALTLFSPQFLASCRSQAEGKTKVKFSLWAVVVLLDYISYHRLSL